ncbi:hypothetical protein TcasGA2_TC031407 [Tribolium castaneum]|uniref:Uncharacterized protein n=1 Tax=Tribolium castaneum TaxID=7070 RepID=A0A139WAQ1_TRICA|nr:hypothetical protein TcasGA2_TC031407 [Tribolium castaneum]
MFFFKTSFSFFYLNTHLNGFSSNVDDHSPKSSILIHAELGSMSRQGQRRVLDIYREDDKNNTQKNFN